MDICPSPADCTGHSWLEALLITRPAHHTRLAQAPLAELVDSSKLGRTYPAKGCSLPSKLRLRSSPCSFNRKWTAYETPVLLLPKVRFLCGAERALEVNGCDLQSGWPVWQYVARAPWWRETRRPDPGRASARTLSVTAAAPTTEPPTARPTLQQASPSVSPQKRRLWTTLLLHCSFTRRQAAGRHALT